MKKNSKKQKKYININKSKIHKLQLALPKPFFSELGVSQHSSRCWSNQIIGAWSGVSSPY